MYGEAVEVTISSFRAELATWLERVRGGDEVVITERGIPVARLTAVNATPLLDRLHQEGVLGKPLRSGRPRATGSRRPTVSGSVAAIISEQRE